MTDIQIIEGIKCNDDRAWRHIITKISPGFFASLKRIFQSGLSDDSLRDIFQDSAIILMNKVKSGAFVCEREGAIFSYLVQIGKLQAMNLVRKCRELTDSEKGAVLLNFYVEDVESDVSTYERQKEENELIEKLINSLPEVCQQILKHFYWGKKSMDDLASMLGMKNADSVKTKKNKCMNKLKEFAAKFLADDEFAEQRISDAVQRNQIKALIVDQLEMIKGGFNVAALDPTDKE